MSALGQKLTPNEQNKLLRGIPRSKYPWTLEAFYARRLRRYVGDWKRTANEHVRQLLNPLIAGGSGVLHDADDDQDHSAEIAIAIGVLLAAVSGRTTEAEMTALATRTVASISSFTFNITQRQAAHVGRKALEHSATIDQYTAMKIKENVALIKSMKEKYLSDLEKTIYRAINEGGGIGQIATAINKVSTMANNHAALIAVDQTGKIAGQLSQYRQKQSGATGYIWRTMEDNRVRPTHAAVDGQFFKYGDGVNGNAPGEEIRCRCISEPVYEP